MPDEIDLIQERENNRQDGLIAKARENASIPDGKPGDCEDCGFYSLRLVGGCCARCRDNAQKTR